MHRQGTRQHLDTEQGYRRSSFMEQLTDVKVKQQDLRTDDNDNGNDNDNDNDNDNNIVI